MIKVAIGWTKKGDFMKKTKHGENIKYCPFMVHHYGLPFLFLGLFGFGNINPKEQPCLKDNCAVWDPEHEICSFRLIGQNA